MFEIRRLNNSVIRNLFEIQNSVIRNLMQINNVYNNHFVKLV